MGRFYSFRKVQIPQTLKRNFPIFTVLSNSLRFLPLLPLCFGLSKAAVVSPVFTENFESYTHENTNTSFYESNAAAFVAYNDAGGDIAMRARIASATSANAWVTVPNSDNRDFSISTVARLAEASPATGSNSTAFSLGAGIPTAENDTINFSYRLNVNARTGGVTFTRSGANVTLTSTTGSATLSASLQTVYTMSINATYDGLGAATFQISVSDGTSTYTGTYNDSSALAANAFGYRVVRASGDGPLSVFYDDFSLQTSVPEPSAALLLFGAAGFSALRRNRR